MNVQAKPPVIWRISDDKPGHDAQSLGLAGALCRITGAHTRDLAAPTARAALATLLGGSFKAGRGLPDPDLIIGAGHATHLPMLAARRARGGRTVVLMKPSLPVACFDLCLIPEHDNPPRRDNVLPTQGPLNTLEPAPAKDPRRGLILLGGPSRHHGWPEDRLIEMIARILKDQSITWELADSARTPVSTRRRLAALRRDNLAYLEYAGTPRTRLAGALGAAGLAWVSEDSMSMIYEALTVGAAVGILELPAKRRDRISRAARRLIEQEWVTTYGEWHETQSLRPPPAALHEAARCARLLVDRYALSMRPVGDG